MELPELKRYRGSNRVLLLFAPERSHPGFMQANGTLEAEGSRLQDFDMRIVTVFGSGRVFEEHQRLDGADAAAFRRRFGAHREVLTVLLLDEDGQVRARQEGALDLPALLATLRGERPH